MSEHGFVFADGMPYCGWYWPLDSPNPLGFPLPPGAVIVMVEGSQADDDRIRVMHEALHAQTPESISALATTTVLEIPPDVRPQPNARLWYRAHGREIIEVDDDETVVSSSDDHAVIPTPRPPKENPLSGGRLRHIFARPDVTESVAAESRPDPQ